MGQKNLRKITVIVIPAFLIFLWSSCHKSPDNNTIPVWEDTGADSVTLTITVITQEGLLLTGCYVNMALSKDSLKNNQFVRSKFTDGAGRAKFNRLYPRMIYTSCFATFGGKPVYGSLQMKLLSSTVRDTTLIVY